MQSNELDLSYYWQVIRRRKWYFLFPLLLILTVALALALMLPPKYTAEGTVLIEAQNIPEELVQSTVTGYVEERLQTLSQIVLSRQNLQELIERYTPYPELQEKAPAEEVIARMREDISMEPVHAEVGGSSGRASTATVAFTVSYEGLDPQVTSQVANALVTLYLEQNLIERKEKASGTVRFFQDQLNQLQTEIEKQEDLIAEFKKENQNALPELMQHNMQSLERIKNEINTRRQDLQTLKERKIYLQGQLATIDPHRPDPKSSRDQPLTLEEELSMLRNQYVTQKSVKSANHPDVVRLKKRIQALEEETSGSESSRMLQTALDEARQNLSELRQKYSDQHPEVIRTQREVDALQQELDQALSSQEAANRADSSGGDFQASNPAYINLQTQIASTIMEIESMKAKIGELENELASYRQRIENSPAVEQRLQALQRNYTNTRNRYQEVMSKLQAAQEAMELEEDQMAEKLTVIEPPVVPESPSKPNRKAIALLGFVLASGFGVGTASLSEFMDRSVRSTQALSAASAKPVLGVIPFLWTARDRRRLWLKRILILLGILALLGFWLFLINEYYQPLDQIWLRIQRAISDAWFQFRQGQNQ